MNQRENIESRWLPKWSDSGPFRRLRQAHLQVLSAWDGIASVADQRVALAKAGTLSAKGIDQHVKKVAEEVIVPKLRRTAHAVDRARKEIVATRAGLGVAKPDPTDVAGAILRSEMRQWLRTMGPGDATAILLDPTVDQSLLHAAFEVPAAMAGIPAEARDRVEAAIRQRAHPTELAILDEMDEAAAVVNAALEVSLSDLAREAGFNESEGLAFDAWMAQASAAINRKIEDEDRTGPAVDSLDLQAAADVINKATEAQLQQVVAFVNARHLAAIGIDSGPVPIPEFAA